jgi:hypothetical protein
VIASILSLFRIKLFAWIAHPAIASLLVMVVPGGLFLLAVSWLYKRWFTANVTNQLE